MKASVMRLVTYAISLGMTTSCSAQVVKSEGGMVFARYSGLAFDKDDTPYTLWNSITDIGAFYLDDVAKYYRVCSRGSSWHCFSTKNWIVFSVPKKDQKIGSKWFFSSREFEYIDNIRYPFNGGESEVMVIRSTYGNERELYYWSSQNGLQGYSLSGLHDRFINFRLTEGPGVFSINWDCQKSRDCPLELSEVDEPTWSRDDDIAPVRVVE